MALSLREASELLGYDRETIRRWLKRGAPHEKDGKDYAIDPKALIEWRVEQERVSAQDRKSEGIEEAKRRKAVEEADQAEIETAKMKGEVVLVEDATAVVRDMLARVRQRLQQMPATAAGRIHEGMTQEERRHEIDAVLQDALAELQEVHFAAA